MTIKFKVAALFRRSVPKAGGEADLVTFVKLTPQDLPAGDLHLGFLEAEVKWHEETWYKNNDGMNVRRIVAAETLVSEVVATHEGETKTFTQDAIVELEIK